jgi:hypothetical protein
MKNYKFRSFLLLSSLIGASYANNYDYKQFQHLVHSNKHHRFANDPQPGYGFSSDLNDFAISQCYAATANITGQTSTLSFSSSMDTGELAKSLGVDVSIKGGFGMFSANAAASYLKEHSETSTDMQIQFYETISNKVDLNYNMESQLLLSLAGQAIYQDGTNDNFRLYCGDTLVTSYDQGALLIMTATLHFTSAKDKEAFKASAGGEFGSYAAFEASVSNDASTSHTNATITISAFQEGGDPTQLSKVLAGVTTSCTADDTTGCTSGMNAIGAYAATDFPSQFTKDAQSIWTGPLVFLGGFTKGPSVGSVLHLAPSFLSPEIQEDRDKLFSSYLLSNYYYTKTYNLINNYPIDLLKTPLADQLTNLYNSSKRNMSVFAGQYTEGSLCNIG